VDIRNTAAFEAKGPDAPHRSQARREDLTSAGGGDVQFERSEYLKATAGMMGWWLIPPAILTAILVAVGWVVFHFLLKEPFWSWPMAVAIVGVYWWSCCYVLVSFELSSAKDSYRGAKNLPGWGSMWESRQQQIRESFAEYSGWEIVRFVMIVSTIVCIGSAVLILLVLRALHVAQLSVLACILISIGVGLVVGGAISLRKYRRQGGSLFG
jgi:hypothetical protein